MFTKILIANRGEIACRISKTAHRLGIKVVAVYSDADRNALHVKLADEAVHIGAAPSSSSYLLGDKVIAAALKTGAQAIHPGYGFLSENAYFAKACADAGLVFIGPPVPAIEAMGSKSAAKNIMGNAGVPLVPGYHGDDQTASVLQQAADEMGYPVLLKAVAGGGGKGMRQVWQANEFDEALAAAKREAQAGFGNDDMLVEKYLTQPRHVEVQVFCDSHNNGVYLFERDCSVQRRHQKVIEEAPAPGMSDALRAEMGSAALCAAQAIDYVGAGTVEFLLDHDGSFYFMEMNTRLQVEHPVTEMITGQDLVEWQLKIAAGQTLPLQQSELSISGHAFEARIYAEDPDNDFLPATGTLNYLRAPEASSYVRIDTGVEEGDSVSVFYDPMIAKLIVWGEDRERALSRLVHALQSYHILGVTTNIEFLTQLASSAPFAAADLDTGFIEKHSDSLFIEQSTPSTADLATVALAQRLVRQQSTRGFDQRPDLSSPWNQSDAWRMNSSCRTVEKFEFGKQEFELGLTQVGNHFEIQIGENQTQATAVLDGDKLITVVDGHQSKYSLVTDDDRVVLFSAERKIEFTPMLADYGESEQDHGSGFRAPMNGTVVAVVADAGANVTGGDALIIIEAMKMEHTIRAPQAGKVSAVFYAAGDLVDGGAELLSFEAVE